MCSPRPILALSLAAGLAAWLIPAESLAQVNPASPVSTPAVTGAIPPLPGASAVLPDAWIAQTDPAAVHGGALTWGPDLLAPGTASKTTWLGWVYPPQPGPHLFAVAPAFRPLLEEQALPAATAHLSALSPGGIAGAFDLFATLNGYDPGASVSFTIPSAPVQRFQGYQPVRGRWLRSQWGHVGPAWYGPEKKYSYADYRGFNELRLQGARLYCAARTAQFAQNGQPLSLGERVGFSVKLLGHTIDFLVIEPTVSLDGPKKFFAGAGAGDAAGNGAQAFTIPFLFGNRVTPVRGLGLPGFGEARVPVDLVTGDSEVRTASDRRPVWVGWNLGGGGVVSPGLQLMQSREYHSVGHADAVMSSGFWLDPSTGEDNRFGVDADFTLFYAGPLRVSALFGLRYEVGRPEVGNSRVLASPLPGWPSETRTGLLFKNPITGIRHHDGAWALGWRRGSPWLEWQVQPEGKTDPFWTWPILPGLLPHDIKALTDDDHLVESRTSLELTLGLKGSIGIPVKFFTLTPEVTGKIKGTVSQSHVLRDALAAEQRTSPLLNRMIPVTAVTVRPRQSADIVFDGLSAGLTFYMDLGWLGEIDFYKQFFKVPGATIAKYDSDSALTPDDERWQMRIGTGASLGQAMTKPAVWSHLPNGAEYNTFDQDVAACLVDPAEPPPPPPPCEPGVDAGGPPRVDMCLYGPTLLFQEGFIDAMVPANVCTNLQPWLASLMLTADQKACLANYFGLLCQPVSKTQTWEGVTVVSRVWNLDETMNDDLVKISQQCAAAFVGVDADAADPAVKAKARQMLDGLISVGMCRSNAELIPDAAILQVVGDPTKAPKAQAGATCKPATPGK